MEIKDCKEIIINKIGGYVPFKPIKALLFTYDNGLQYIRSNFIDMPLNKNIDYEEVLNGVYS